MLHLKLVKINAENNSSALVSTGLFIGTDTSKLHRSGLQNLFQNWTMDGPPVRVWVKLLYMFSVFWSDAGLVEAVSGSFHVSNNKNTQSFLRPAWFLFLSRLFNFVFKGHVLVQNRRLFRFVCLSNCSRIVFLLRNKVSFLQNRGWKK